PQWRLFSRRCATNGRAPATCWCSRSTSSCSHSRRLDCSVGSERGVGDSSVSTTHTAARLERWARWEDPALEAMPYILLVLCTARAATIDAGHEDVILDLVLALATGAWMLSMYTLNRRNRANPRVMAVYFAGLIALMAALVIVDPIYGFFTWTGYIWTFRVL